MLEDVDRILGNDNATVFEILTCAFIKYAESFKDNVNIIEAGLFHRFDSTNVFKKNLLTLLGVIHLDHLNWLDNKSIDGVIYEKTSSLPTSSIFINNQMNSEIKTKIKKSLIENKLSLPAYDQCLKASHIFNLLDARGVIAVAERTGYINRIRELAKGAGSGWLENQDK